MLADSSLTEEQAQLHVRGSVKAVISLYGKQADRWQDRNGNQNVVRVLRCHACSPIEDRFYTIVGIERLLDDLKVTAAKVCVTAAKLKLVLFINFNEKYAK
ncbi:hypothetical protein Tco_0256709 [Tanacetum coccineum]